MFNNGINPEQAGGLLLAQVLAKVSRGGKYINVRRTIRDFEDIEDYASRGGDRTSVTQLAEMLQGPKATAPAPTTGTDLGTTVRLDALESKLDELLAKLG